ncbi:MAG: ABC transporter ATP-binding protein [Phycisphaerales bacterium]|nr:ABC transporter ATP-binding protein [Phycisphaerales bacterium]
MIAPPPAGPIAAVPLRHREPPPADAMLCIRNLRVQFGSLLAVNDVSFSLRAGQLMGMIGPNGAGKSTTLRAAAGLQPLTSGSIHVMGHDVTVAATDAGSHLGFAPDTPAVYDQLTVEQFLNFIGNAYRLGQRLTMERIDHWLEALWLGDKRSARIGTLSRGMKQRLQVARTLLPDPSVVLLDEPAAGLDPAGRVQFRRLLAGLRDQGKAIIVSSHILADLAEYCTHIGIMGHGRMLQFGTVAEVAAGAGGDRGTYRVLLAERVGDLAARLAELWPPSDSADAVRVVSCGGDSLVVDGPVARDAAAGILRQLVRSGLDVCEFQASRPDLEQAYLRTGLRQVD